MDPSGSDSIMWGGVDGDTEVNGCEMNGQFTDVVWITAMLFAGEVPPFAVFPLAGTVCEDYSVPPEAEIEVASDDCEVVLS